MKNLVLMVQALMLLAVACGPIAVYANSGGNSAFKSGNYGSALRKYEQARSLTPDQMELLYNTGNALYRQREFGEARERYQDVLVSADEEIAVVTHLVDNGQFVLEPLLHIITGLRVALLGPLVREVFQVLRVRLVRLG